MASPKNIGIALVIAAAGGFVPGVPGLVGGDSADAAEESAEDSMTAESESEAEIELVRLLVEPVEVDEDDMTADTEATPQPTPQPTSPPNEGSGAGVPGAAEREREYIDPAVLAQLTDGATLHVDRRGRPWARFPDGTRVPLFHSENGSAVIEERIADAAQDPVATPTPIPTPTPPPWLAAPIMEEVAQLDGVVEVVVVGDGTYEVTLEDPSVLDDLPLEILDELEVE